MPYIDKADLKAAKTLLLRVEIMDLALLGTLTSCLFHTYARRLNGVDIIQHTHHLAAWKPTPCA